MTLIDKIREAVFRDPPVIRKEAASYNPTEVIGGIEVFKLGAAAPTVPPATPQSAYGQSRRHRGR